MYYYVMNCRSEGAAAILCYLFNIFFPNKTYDAYMYNEMFTR